MRLLLDENISYRVAQKIKQSFKEVSHVKYHNLLESDDKQVWEFAKNNNFTIVTNDSDFNDFSLVSGFPPKIIWLHKGNINTQKIVELLKFHQQKILEFINDKQNGILIFK